MVDILRAYRDPERYAQELGICTIVADEKVHGEGVKRYVRLIKEGAHVKPIIVVKHPKVDEYAVLNGHHRFWAYKELGVEKVEAVVVEDLIGLGFHMTKNGHLQPPAGFTKYVRVPAKEFQSYIEEFWKDPGGMLRKQLKRRL